jgi:hypothetical protein
MDKGPAASQSDNLNPWQWKKERAPRYKNTAPSVKESVNTFEKGECSETEYVLVPAAAVDKLKGYVPVDRLTAKRILEQNPAIHGSENTQDRREARSNAGIALNPLARAQELTTPPIAPCSQSAGPVLAPMAAPDKLEGYEPQYFLKEDGKDYDVP